MSQVERQTVSVSEAAEILGISRSHAFDLVNRGEIPGVVRLGTRIVITKRALEKLLDGAEPATARASVG